MAFLVGCPSYLFIELYKIMKRLLGMWSLISITDPDRLLGSCLLEFLSLVSFLLGLLILLRCDLPRTSLLVVPAILIIVDAWKD